MSISAVPAQERNGLLRLRLFFGRHPLIGDVVPVVLLMLITSPQLHSSETSIGARIGFILALMLPLVARRRYPFATFVVVAAVALLQFVLDFRYVFDIALLAALYSVALRGQTRSAIAASVILEIGVVLTIIRWRADAPIIPSLVFLSGLNAAALISGAYLRTRQVYFEEERESQALLAAAAERARIAREMHDIVSHSLSVIVTLADGATYVAETSPDKAKDAMHSVAATGREAMREMRLLLDVLRSDSSDDAELNPQPGLIDLQNLIEQVRNTGLKVRYDISGQPVPLPRGVELTIYRIVQEALSNVLKHGRNVDEVAIALVYKSGSIDLTIQDNGELSLSSTVNGGHGLHGMQERTDVYGGSLTAGATESGGWLVSFHLQLDKLESA